jgi:hypothetical protein
MSPYNAIPVDKAVAPANRVPNLISPLAREATDAHALNEAIKKLRRMAVFEYRANLE